MILKSEIKDVARSLKQRFKSMNLGIKKMADWELPSSPSLALIISGIRRSGKSTLMYQLIDKLGDKCFFLNLDDPRLFGFELTDFSSVNEIIEEGQYVFLFLMKFNLFKTGNGIYGN